MFGVILRFGVGLVFRVIPRGGGIFPGHVFYHCALITGYIHSRSGNRYYYAKVELAERLGLVGFYARLLRSDLAWVFVLMLRFIRCLHTI